MTEARAAHRGTGKPPPLARASLFNFDFPLRGGTVRRRLRVDTAVNCRRIGAATRVGIPVGFHNRFPKNRLGPEEPEPDLF